MRRKNVNIPIWQDNIVKFLSSEYAELSESKIIRIAISYFLICVAEATKIEKGMTLKSALEIIVKIKKDKKMDWEDYEKVLFTAQKIAEKRMKNRLNRKQVNSPRSAENKPPAELLPHVPLHQS